jgi:hypothetical protein
MDANLKQTMMAILPLAFPLGGGALKIASFRLWDYL